MSDYEQYVDKAAGVFYEARTKNNWLVCTELYRGLADLYRGYARAALDAVGPLITQAAWDVDELPHEVVLSEDERSDH